MNNKRKTNLLFVAILAIACLLPTTASAKTKLCNPKASKEAKALYKKLQRIQKDGKMLSGQMWAPWGIDEIEKVKEITGKYPAVRGHDLIHDRSNQREVELMTDWHRRGGIVTLMWHWGAPTKGEGYEQSKMTIDVAKCFVDGTAENKAMWDDLKRVADWLTILRDEKVPVLWRPMHEFDGKWFWYGKGGGKNFVRLWETMYNYFTQERKLNNLIWVLPHSGNIDTTYMVSQKLFDIAGPDTYSEKAQQGLYYKTEEMYGKGRMIPLHECGTLPDPEECKKNNTRWIWWMLWHTGHLTDHNKEELIRIYNHPDVLTLEEIQ